MNFLGIGPAEIVLILVVMFVFAGPKRMVAWAYYLGRYVQKFRVMFDETWGMIRKEFEAAQIDLPEDPRNLKTQAGGVISKLNQTFEKELEKSAPGVGTDLKQVAAEMKDGLSVSKVSKYVATSEPNAQPVTVPAPPNGQSEPASPSSSNGDEGSKYDAWLPK